MIRISLFARHFSKGSRSSEHRSCCIRAKKRLTFPESARLCYSRAIEDCTYKRSQVLPESPLLHGINLIQERLTAVALHRPYAEVMSICG
jgi:hypothetical protein